MNSEQIRLQKYYFKHRKRILVNNKNRYELNKKEILKRMKKKNRTLESKHIRLRVSLRKERVPKTDLLWSFNFYAELIRDRLCHYCCGFLNPSGHGLDSANNKLGHVAYNVVPCCWSCNKIKSDEFSYAEMMLLSPILKIIRRSKNDN